MSTSPQVSVVMSVHNGGRHLRQSVESVLNQQGIDFEFIVVDDGSTDESGAVLADYACQDYRIRLFRRANQGLTKALLFACAQARAPFIARQDAGDSSLPHRLEHQLELLEQSPETVMTACGVRFVTPAKERLFDKISAGSALDRGLRNLSISSLRGPPHHGATMFRRRTYEAAGGYRTHFRVAQDIDLWLRLSELGQCLGGNEIFYQATIEPDSISMRCPSAQIYFGKLAIESARLRRAGLDDSGLFRNLSSIRIAEKSGKNAADSDYYYFLASVLRNTSPDAARKYLTRAVNENPYHIRARLLKLITSLR